MDIHIGAHVEATDGRVGEVTRVVVEAQDQVLTHIVVGARVLGVERQVPIEEVADATPERVALLVSRADFENLPPFERTVAYTPPSAGDIYLDQVRRTVEVDQVDIAEDEIAVRGGERVEATDGAIGRVDGVVVDPASRAVTHIVLREGHLWHTRTVTIPVGHIDRVERGVIYLTLSKAQVEPLSKAPNA